MIRRTCFDGSSNAAKNQRFENVSLNRALPGKGKHGYKFMARMPYSSITEQQMLKYDCPGRYSLTISEGVSPVVKARHAFPSPALLSARASQIFASLPSLWPSAEALRGDPEAGFFDIYTTIAPGALGRGLNSLGPAIPVNIILVLRALAIRRSRSLSLSGRASTGTTAVGGITRPAAPTARAETGNEDTQRPRRRAARPRRGEKMKDCDEGPRVWAINRPLDRRGALPIGPYLRCKDLPTRSERGSAFDWVSGGFGR